MVVILEAMEVVVAFEAMAKTKEVMAAGAGVVILVETKEDKVDGMVAMDKTKEVVVVMEEEIVIMAHHLEEEAAEVPCEEVQDMEANEEAGVEVMETTVLPLILLVEVAVVAEEECKKFQKKFPAKSRPRLTITILDFTKWITTKKNYPQATLFKNNSCKHTLICHILYH